MKERRTHTCQDSEHTFDLPGRQTVSVSVRIPGANLTHLELFVLSLESVTPPKGTNLVPTFPIGLNCIHTSFFSSTCHSFINHKPKDNKERKTRVKTRTFHGNCIRFTRYTYLMTCTCTTSPEKNYRMLASERLKSYK